MATQIQTTAGEVRKACVRRQSLLRDEHDAHVADCEAENAGHSWLWRLLFGSTPIPWDDWRRFTRWRIERLLESIAYVNDDRTILLDEDDAHRIMLGAGGDSD